MFLVVTELVVFVFIQNLEAQILKQLYFLPITKSKPASDNFNRITSNVTSHLSKHCANVLRIVHFDVLLLKCMLF